VPMVSFAALVVIPYNSDAIHNVDHGVFKSVRCVFGYGYKSKPSTP
jgi:hypothetical protein